MQRADASASTVCSARRGGCGHASVAWRTYKVRICGEASQLFSCAIAFVLKSCENVWNRFRAPIWRLDSTCPIPHGRCGPFPSTFLSALMHMRRVTPGCPLRASPLLLCYTSAPRDTASRYARNTEAPFTSRSPTLLYASRAAGWQRAQLGGVVSGGFPRGRAVGVRRVTHPMRLPHESVLSLHTALRGYPRRSRRTLVTPQHCMFVVVSRRRTLRRTLRIFVRARVSSESGRNRCRDRCRNRCRSRRSCPRRCRALCLASSAPPYGALPSARCPCLGRDLVSSRL